MTGTKRSSAEAGVSTDSPKAKAAKTDTSSSKKEKVGAKSAAKNGKGGGVKTTMTSSTFKSKALPLHVNITHTPPVIPEEEGKVPASSADPGFIGSSTLVPSVFSTGSFGWKGSKRVTIEVENPEGGEKEKVQVMISINATVLGSKKKKKEQEDENHDENADSDEKVDEASIVSDE